MEKFKIDIEKEVAKTEAQINEASALAEKIVNIGREALEEVKSDQYKKKFYLTQNKKEYKRRSKIFADNINNAIDTIEGAKLELKEDWENISDYPLPYQLITKKIFLNVFDATSFIILKDLIAMELHGKYIEILNLKEGMVNKFLNHFISKGNESIEAIDQLKNYDLPMLNDLLIELSQK